MKDENKLLLKFLYESDNKWFKLPLEFRINANTKNKNSAVNKEMYYTTTENKQIGDYIVGDEINLIIVGRYEWKYYFEEDSYDIRDGYFISYAKTDISNTRLNSEDVYTIDELEIEPIFVGPVVKYISINSIFDKAKRNALDISSFINKFIDKN